MFICSGSLYCLCVHITSVSVFFKLEKNGKFFSHFFLVPFHIISNVDIWMKHWMWYVCVETEQKKRLVDCVCVIHKLIFCCCCCCSLSSPHNIPAKYNLEQKQDSFSVVVGWLLLLMAIAMNKNWIESNEFVINNLGQQQQQRPKKMEKKERKVYGIILDNTRATAACNILEHRRRRLRLLIFVFFFVRVCVCHRQIHFFK